MNLLNEKVKHLFQGGIDLENGNISRPLNSQELEILQKHYGKSLKQRSEFDNNWVIKKIQDARVEFFEKLKQNKGQAIITSLFSQMVFEKYAAGSVLQSTDQPLGQFFLLLEGEIEITGRKYFQSENKQYFTNLESSTVNNNNLNKLMNSNLIKKKSSLLRKQTSTNLGKINDQTDFDKLHNSIHATLSPISIEPIEAHKFQKSQFTQEFKETQSIEVQGLDSPELKKFNHVVLHASTQSFGANRVLNISNASHVVDKFFRNSQLQQLEFQACNVIGDQFIFENDMKMEKIVAITDIQVLSCPIIEAARILPGLIETEQMLIQKSILQKIPLFSKLDRKQITTLVLNSGPFIKIQKKTIIYHQNDDSRSFFIIQRGEISLSSQFKVAQLKSDLDDYYTQNVNLLNRNSPEQRDQIKEHQIAILSEMQVFGLDQYEHKGKHQPRNYTASCHLLEGQYFEIRFDQCNEILNQLLDIQKVLNNSLTTFQQNHDEFHRERSETINLTLQKNQILFQMGEEESKTQMEASLKEKRKMMMMQLKLVQINDKNTLNEFDNPIIQTTLKSPKDHNSSQDLQHYASFVGTNQYTQNSNRDKQTKFLTEYIEQADLQQKTLLNNQNIKNFYNHTYKSPVTQTKGHTSTAINLHSRSQTSNSSILPQFNETSPYPQQIPESIKQTNNSYHKSQMSQYSTELKAAYDNVDLIRSQNSQSLNQTYIPSSSPPPEFLTNNNKKDYFFLLPNFQKNEKSRKLLNNNNNQSDFIQMPQIDNNKQHSGFDFQTQESTFVKNEPVERTNYQKSKKSKQYEQFLSTRDIQSTQQMDQGENMAYYMDTKAQISEQIGHTSGNFNYRTETCIFPNEVFASKFKIKKMLFIKQNRLIEDYIKEKNESLLKQLDESQIDQSLLLFEQYKRFTIKNNLLNRKQFCGEGVQMDLYSKFPVKPIIVNPSMAVQNTKRKLQNSRKSQFDIDFLTETQES